MIAEYRFKQMHELHLRGMRPKGKTENRHNHASVSAQALTAASHAVLRTKAEARAIWRDPVLAAAALAQLQAERKPRPGRVPKAPG